MSNPLDRPGISVGVSISPSSYTAAKIDKGGELVESRTVVSKETLEHPVAGLVELISSFQAKYPEISVIGVAAPGLINRTVGTVAYSANIPEHSSLNLKDLIKEATGLEAIIENDANAAAYGELILGAGRGASDMFYATIGEGVGGAFVINGKLWHGSSGYAGEFGYVTVNSEGMRLEDVASSTNIVRRTRNRFNRDSTSSLARLSEEEITLAEIVKAAEDDDDFARLMLERTGLYVGSAIASVINLLNIETIVVGGEIMESHHIVLDAIIERAREFSFARSFEKTRILAGELGSNAAAIGAALIASAEN